MATAREGEQETVVPGPSLEEALRGSCWGALEESPLAKALATPLPFELALLGHEGGGSPGSESDEEGPGPWCRGLQWLDQLHRTRAIQRHLVRFSDQGDVLFPEDYVALIIDREEREWREWEHQEQTRHLHYAANVGQHPQRSMVNYLGDEDDDDDDDEDDDDGDDPRCDIPPETLLSDPHHQRLPSSYAQALAGLPPKTSSSSTAQGMDDVDGGDASFETTRLSKKKRLVMDGSLSEAGAGVYADRDEDDLVMYNESGRPFAVYGGDDYHPASSQYDPRTGFMTASASPREGGAPPSANLPATPSSPSNRSAFQHYEDFGHWTTDRP